MSLLSWLHNLFHPQHTAPVAAPQPAGKTIIMPPSITPSTEPITSWKLPWEDNGHSERAGWTAALAELMTHYIDILDTAQDIEKFRPGYHQMTTDQRVHVWSILICWLCDFECSWNPNESSVDAGTKDDIDSYSVGMMQMSVCDQENYGVHLGYNFDDLKDPIKGLTLGVAIFAQQISKYGTVLISHGKPGVYWSTLEPGGHDGDHSQEIIAKVKAAAI